MRMTGAIRAIKKGHGYIAGDDGCNYYLHWTGMRSSSKDFRDLALRERVEFEVKPNSKQASTPRAVDVIVLPLPKEEQDGDSSVASC